MRRLRYYPWRAAECLGASWPLPCQDAGGRGVSHHVCYTPRGWPACFMGEGSLGNSFSASRLLEDSLFFNPTRLAPVESRMHYSIGHPPPSVRHAWANPNLDPNPNLRARERRT